MVLQLLHNIEYFNHVSEREHEDVVN